MLLGSARKVARMDPLRRSPAAALLLALAVAWIQAKPGLPPAEVDARAKLARTWSDFAKWCLERGQKEAGLAAVQAAVEAGLPDKTAAPLKSGLEAAAAKPDDPALAAKKRETGAAAAKLHAKLFELALAAKAADRADAALAAELALDPESKGARKELGALVKAAVDHGWNEVAGRWLLRARTLDPVTWAAGKFRDAQVALGKKDVIVLGGGEHSMVAYVSLPNDWAPDKKGLPIVVAVEGAGCGFAGCCRLYRETRGARAAIVVTPCSFSNTNGLEAAKYPWYDAAALEKYKAPGAARVEYDAAGLAAVLAELKKDWGGGEKLAITGFSGGGNLTYYWTLQHPETLSLAVGCCANFGGLGLQGAKPVAGGGPPVVLLTGEKDDFNLEVFGQKPGIVGQTDAVEESLKKLGFTNVSRRVVPGAGHSNFAADVWKAFLPE